MSKHSSLIEEEKKKYNFIHGLHFSYGKKSVRYVWFEDDDKEFVQLLKVRLIASKRILDMGCGKCGFIEFFSKRYELPIKRFHGMDLSEKALERSPKKIITTLASIDDIPSKDQHFTTVMHFDGMEHIPVEMEEKAMSELFRVADKFVALTIHMGGCIEDKLMKKHGYGGLHVNVKNFEAWSEFLETQADLHGFEVVFMENHKNHARVLIDRKI